MVCPCPYPRPGLDLEGQGQLPLKTIGILTKVFCFSGPNLVILAWTGDELSYDKQVIDTHTEIQAMTIPRGQKNGIG